MPSDGIFKSTDGGQTWTAINSGLVDPVTAIAPLDVAALAIDPDHAGTLLAGTRFSEIFKTTDGGATWAAANSGLTAGRIFSLAIDPATPAKIYAGTPLGVFRSTDGR